MACFKELDDVEFEKWVRRREEKKKRMESGGVSGWGSSFFCLHIRGSEQSRGSENDDE